MKKIGWLILLGLWGAADAAPKKDSALSGEVLAESASAKIWWAESGAAKIRPDRAAPKQRGEALQIRAARNETDAAQCVVRPFKPLRGVRVECGPLKSADGEIGADRIEVLRVGYVKIEQATDRAGSPGLWPDPLLPIGGPLDLEPGRNQPFWIRVAVPRDAKPGVYQGTLRFLSKDWKAAVPVELTVFGFTLPDRMTCTTAFGFTPGNVFRYQRLKTDKQKRMVLEKYWTDLAAHHISPYDPAPLDPVRTTWPAIRPPRTIWDNWTNLRIVTNEVHAGKGAMLLHDDKTDPTTTRPTRPHRRPTNL